MIDVRTKIDRNLIEKLKEILLHKEEAISTMIITTAVTVTVTVTAAVTGRSKSNDRSKNMTGSIVTI